MIRFNFSLVLVSLLTGFTPGLSAEERMTVLVYPFENAGESKFSWVSAGMTSTVVSDLSTVKGITVISDADRKKALQELAFAQAGLIDEKKVLQAGKILGADMILSGNYIVASGRIRVNVTMTETESGKIRKSARIDGVLDDLFSVQDQIVNNLLTEAERITTGPEEAVRISTGDRIRFEKIQRPAVTAYEFYARGAELMSEKPAEALNYFKKAVSLQPDYLEACTAAGVTAAGLPGHHDEAVKYLNFSDNLHRKRDLTGTASYADLKNIFGNLYYKKGDFSRSLSYYNESRSIRKTAGLENTFGYADTLTSIGNVHYSTGSSAEAFRFYADAGEIRSRSGGEKTSAYAVLLMNMGIASAGQGRFDETLNYFKKSENLYRELMLENTYGFSGLLMNTGNVYLIRNDSDNALKYFLSSKDIMDKLRLQKTSDYASLLFNAGIAYEKKGDIQTAGEWYRQAYQIYEDSGYSGPQKNEALKNAVRLGR